MDLIETSLTGPLLLPPALLTKCVGVFYLFSSSIISYTWQCQCSQVSKSRVRARTPQFVWFDIHLAQRQSSLAAGVAKPGLFTPGKHSPCPACCLQEKDLLLGMLTKEPPPEQIHSAVW